MPKLIILNLEELFYRFFTVPLVAFLPAQWAYGVACRRADWRYRHDTRTRERILHNLKEFFGTRLSREEYACITRNFLRRRSCEFIDAMRLSGKGRALARLVEIRGLEYIEAALDSGKGAMLCCGHFGSYNAAFSLLGAYGYPITAVGNWRTTEYPGMSRVKGFIFNASFNNKIARHRRRPNIEPMKERLRSALRIAEVLRANELVAIPIDAPYTFAQPRAKQIGSNALTASAIGAATPSADRSRTVQVDFLDRQILLMPGSVKIAQLTGSTVLVAVVHRSADWRHQVLKISPPVSMDGDTATVLKRCVKMLEGPIDQNPAYWDWWSDRQDLVDLGLLPVQG